MSYNKVLAIEYLKKGNRVFVTDSPDNSLLVVWSTRNSKENIRRNHRENPKRFPPLKDVKLVSARLETNSYSLPFRQPHPLLGVKVKIKEELYL